MKHAGTSGENINKSDFPGPQNSQIWLDFDGTATEQDVLDELIKTFAINDSWKISEARWQAGQIGSRQCLEEQFELVRVTENQLETALSRIQLDEGLFKLMEVAKSYAVEIAIVSDCGDMFIRKILSRYGISNLPFRSNKASLVEDRIKLSFPYYDESCGAKAAHCKCTSIRQMNKGEKKIIYIGDGRSDLCAARIADMVFAKNILADCLFKENIRFEKFSNLKDVAEKFLLNWRKQKCSAQPQYNPIYIKTV